MTPNARRLQTAVAAAKAGGKVLMAHYGKLKTGDVSQKAKNDFVTKVDKASEKVVLGVIAKAFPKDTIQAEESGVTPGKGALWIVDPLDGTSNYIHHFPQFCVSVGVLVDGELACGAIHDPLHDELFTAVAGGGAFLNGKKIAPSPVEKLANAFMATGFPFRARERFEGYRESFTKILLGSSSLRRGGSAALDLAYVASGRFDGFWELDLSPWDIAAGALILKEAGGRITDMWGKDGYLNSGDTVASNGRIHDELVGVTSKIFTPTGKNKLWRSA